MLDSALNFLHGFHALTLFGLGHVLDIKVSRILLSKHSIIIITLHYSNATNTAQMFSNCVIIFLFNHWHSALCFPVSALPDLSDLSHAYHLSAQQSSRVGKQNVSGFIAHRILLRRQRAAVIQPSPGVILSV